MKVYQPIWGFIIVAFVLVLPIILLATYNQTERQKQAIKSYAGSAMDNLLLAKQAGENFDFNQFNSQLLWQVLPIR